MDFIKEMLERLSAEKPTIEVGKMSDETLAAFKQYKKIENILDEDIDLRVKQYEIEIRRKLQAEFDERREELEKKHSELWAIVYKELNLDPDRHYSYDKNTNVVSMEVEDEDDALTRRRAMKNNRLN